jgi:hypothetical protein
MLGWGCFTIMVIYSVVCLGYVIPMFIVAIMKKQLMYWLLLWIPITIMFIVTSIMIYIILKIDARYREEVKKSIREHQYRHSRIINQDVIEELPNLNDRKVQLTKIPSNEKDCEIELVNIRATELRDGVEVIEIGEMDCEIEIVRDE